MSLIKINNISFTYNKKSKTPYLALNDISFDINNGDFLCIVGKTGSGKSTLIETLNALLLPTKGFNKIKNTYITSDKKIIKNLKKEGIKINKKKDYTKIRKEVGIVFQFSEYQLFSTSVIKDVMFGPLNYGFNKKEAKETAIKALKEVGIDESYFERSPFDLSGGEKRKVAIAGILAFDPSVIIMDEPTVGLDPTSKLELLELIKDLNKKGKTIIIVTHDMDIVFNYAKNVVILKDSKLIKKVSVDELKLDPNLNEYSLSIPPLFEFKNLLKKYGFICVENLNSLEEIVLKLKENYEK